MTNKCRYGQNKRGTNAKKEMFTRKGLCKFLPHEPPLEHYGLPSRDPLKERYPWIVNPIQSHQ